MGPNAMFIIQTGPASGVMRKFRTSFFQFRNFARIRFTLKNNKLL